MTDVGLFLKSEVVRITYRARIKYRGTFLTDFNFNFS